MATRRQISAHSTVWAHCALLQLSPTFCSHTQHLPCTQPLGMSLLALIDSAYLVELALLASGIVLLALGAAPVAVGVALILAWLVFTPLLLFLVVRCCQARSKAEHSLDACAAALRANSTFSALISQPLHGLEPSSLQIVTSSSMMLHAPGCQRCHPFDLSRAGRLLQQLRSTTPVQCHSPVNAVLDVRTGAASMQAGRVAALATSIGVASAVEVPLIAPLPSLLLYGMLTRPSLAAAAGSVTGMGLALRAAQLGKTAGLAAQACAPSTVVSVSGGYHHASYSTAHGFCMIPDVTLALAAARAALGDDARIAVVDLDVHCGDGHLLDAGNLPNVFIYDACRTDIFPADPQALSAADRCRPLRAGMGAAEYLRTISDLPAWFQHVQPAAVVYVAGTDILDGDPLGGLQVSARAVAARDALVWACTRPVTATDVRWTAEEEQAGVPAAWTTAGSRYIPMLQLPAGGYQFTCAEAIAESLARCHRLFVAGE